MEVDMHSFSANCATDKMGGDDNSLYADGVRPSQFTIDKNPKYAVIAVSKKGGTNGLRKQCFRATGGVPRGSNARSQLNKIRNTFLVASDGCAECNGKNRVDVASSCESGLSDDFTIEHLQLHEESCPPEIEAILNPTVPARKATKRTRMASSTR